MKRILLIIGLFAGIAALIYFTTLLTAEFYFDFGYEVGKVDATLECKRVFDHYWEGVQNNNGCNQSY